MFAISLLIRGQSFCEVERFEKIVAIFTIISAIIITIEYIQGSLIPYAPSIAPVVGWVARPVLSVGDLIVLFLIIGALFVWREGRIKRKKQLVQKEEDSRLDATLQMSDSVFGKALQARYESESLSVKELLEDRYGQGFSDDDIDMLRVILIHNKKTPREIAVFTGKTGTLILERVEFMKGKKVLVQQQSQEGLNIS